MRIGSVGVGNTEIPKGNVLFARLPNHSNRPLECVPVAKWFAVVGWSRETRSERSIADTIRLRDLGSSCLPPDVVFSRRRASAMSPELAVPSANPHRVTTRTEQDRPQAASIDQRLKSVGLSSQPRGVELEPLLSAPRQKSGDMTGVTCLPVAAMS